MARITVEDCIDKFESRFELVLVASNRARKLHSGENPTIDKDNDKNTVIALREIADETVSIEEMKNSLVEEYQTVSSQSEEDLSLEYSESSIENENFNDQDKILNSEEKIITDNIDLEEVIKESENIDIDDKSVSNEDINSVDNEISNNVDQNDTISENSEEDSN